MITALLKGCAKNSAESRLRIWNLTKNSERDTQDDTVQMEIRDNMIKVVQKKELRCKTLEQIKRI